MIDPIQLLFLEILSDLLTGKINGPYRIKNRTAYLGLQKLAIQHNVLPLIVDGILNGGMILEIGETPLPITKRMMNLYRNDVIRQAQRTADFLLLYEYLWKQGLHPAVMKGIVCRSLYPIPEHRPSVDEDLLIDPKEFKQYHEAITSYGLALVNPEEDCWSSSEVSYEDKEKRLYIEIHKTPFSCESDVYSYLNECFEGIYSRETTLEIYKTEIHTLGHTDHLLYLLLHAFKHFLHSGFGIRQICDIGIYAKQYSDRIEWIRIRQKCEEASIEQFAAAVFRISEKYLGFEMPSVFEDLEVDERDLLEDILTGGLYGVNDINRAHSSTITLGAVTKQKQGKKNIGFMSAVFLPLSSMKGKYPYLKKSPWLLPAAWIQRVFHYILKREKNVDPIESLRIGNERVAILREYGIIK